MTEMPHASSGGRLAQVGFARSELNATKVPQRASTTV